MEIIKKLNINYQVMKKRSFAFKSSIIGMACTNEDENKQSNNFEKFFFLFLIAYKTKPATK